MRKMFLTRSVVARESMTIITTREFARRADPDNKLAPAAVKYFEDTEAATDERRHASSTSFAG